MWCALGTDRSGAIFGTIIIGALLAAMDTNTHTPLVVVAVSAVAVALCWLAQANAAALGKKSEPGSDSRSPRRFRCLAPVVGTGTTDAVLAALSAAVAVLVALVIIGGRRAGMSGAASAVPAAIIAALVIGVIILKANVHQEFTSAGRPVSSALFPFLGDALRLATTRQTGLRQPGNPGYSSCIPFCDEC